MTRRSKLVLGITLLLLFTFSAAAVMAESGFESLRSPRVIAGTWSELGIIQADVPAYALKNDDPLLIRLPEDFKYYAGNLNIAGPDIAGTSVTYTITGSENGRVRIVIPSSYNGSANDLYNAAGNDPFSISLNRDNELMLTLQNYTSTGGINKFYLYLDNVYIDNDFTGNINIALETSSDSGWPVNQVNIGDAGKPLPDAPGDLTVVGITDTGCQLSWQDYAVYEDGFYIYLKKQGESFKKYAEAAKDITKYTLTGLEPQTNYLLRINAYNKYGYSDYSNTVSIETKSKSELRFVIDENKYYLNGKEKILDSAPVIRQDKAFLPIRALVEAIGADIEWNNAEQKVTIKRDSETIEMWIGNHEAQVNDKVVAIDPDNNSIVPFIEPPGRTMIPLRFINEILGAQVEWQEDTREVIVTYLN